LLYVGVLLDNDRERESYLRPPCHFPQCITAYSTITV